MNEVLRDIVATLSACPEVDGIALGGSRAARSDDAKSDYDVIVFADAQVPVDVRRALAERHDANPEIANMFWGEGDYWFADGIAYDVYFFGTTWMADEVRGSVKEFRARDGYSTCLWFTTQHMEILFDRAGRLAEIQSDADVTYPDELARSIITHNLTLADGLHTSYRNQLALALKRGDLVSAQHRTTALLACVFDILFAHARMPHPGEKRQIAALRGRIDDGHLGRIERATSIHDDHLVTVDALLDELRALVATDLPETPDNKRV